MNRLFSLLILMAMSVPAWPQEKSGMNYSAQWKTIDKLIEAGQPKSALTEIDKVYQAALKDKEYGHLVKSVTLRISCMRSVEENPSIAIIESLKKDAGIIPFPARNIIYSFTADEYLNFYRQNRWKIYDRTAVAETGDSDHPETWDMTRIMKEVIHYYQLSLYDPAGLQKVPVSGFKEILSGDASSRYLRPTLYDLLAHKVIDTYTQRDLSMTDFATPLPLDQIEYFSDAQRYAGIKIKHDDTLSFTYQTMKLFQELTAFRLIQNDINALTDVTLKRYEYVRQNGIYKDTKALYEDAMKHLMEYCAGQKIWGKVAYTMAYYYKSEGDRWNYSKDNKTRYKIREAVLLCQDIQKNAILKEDKKYAGDMLKEITRIDGNLQVEKNILPGKPALALIRYKNTSSLYLTIYHYNQENYKELEQYSDDAAEKARRILSKQRKVSTRQINLPVQTDYQDHQAEIRIDSLPPGKYLLVLSDKSSPERDKMELLNYHVVQATCIKMVQRLAGAQQVEAYITDAWTGTPLHDIQVDVIANEYNRQLSSYVDRTEQTFRTDSNGMVMYTFSDRTNNMTFRVTNGNDILQEKMIYHYPSRQKEERNTVVFFTDRAIYRPGQTICFKGLVYSTDHDGDNKIQAGQEVKVRFEDANGNDITSQTFKSNEYGTFNGTFSVPVGLLNGQMYLKSDNGTATVTIEEYKRPTFEINMKPVAGSYRLGDMITLRGEAKALAGYAVDGASLKYSVVRYSEHRIYRSWRIMPPISDRRQIASGTLLTDDKGMFSVSFKAEDKDIKDDNLIYIYELTVDVTDSNGETHTKQQTVMLSKTSLLLNTSIPERIIAGSKQDDSFTYDLKTTNLDNISVSANVNIELYRLKSPDVTFKARLWDKPDTMVMSYDEFKESFPNDIYMNEDDPVTYPKEQIASWTIDTGSVEKIKLDALKDAPAGWYSIRMKAVAGQQSITDSLYIQVLKENKPVGSMKNWFIALSESGKPGDSVTFRITGCEENAVARYDVLFKDKVVDQQWIAIDSLSVNVTVPVQEIYRGGFAIQVVMVQDNRTYTAMQEIKVPYTNKELDITFTSFRDQLLPGEKEKWTLTVKNKEGEQETAEMVASLYDASLDSFVPNRWPGPFYPARSHSKYAWQSIYSPLISMQPIINHGYFTPFYPADYESLTGVVNAPVLRRARMQGGNGGDMMYKAAIATVDVPAMDVVLESKAAGIVTENKVMAEPAPDLTGIPLRTNFNETAFFYPALRTNEKGEINIEFTIPEALTRWNMLGFAHTLDFKTGSVTNQLITQKQIAISANLPRFFRQGDTLVLAAKVNNMTNQNLKGNALLRLYDAFTMQPVDATILKTNGTQAFSVQAEQSTNVQWKLVIPGNIQAVTYRLTAQAGHHTDGEERSVPVLSNRILVTESMPFMVRGGQKEDFRFDRLIDGQTNTLQNHRLTLEYTSNPAWYAVQAIPYIMEYPYECSEQVFARFYANSVAATVVNSSPRIKQIFSQWGSIPDSKALLSNLEKNQELKQALLEETPWVAQASGETERKKRMGMLFDLNRMAGEQKKELEQLKAAQGANGGFPWFKGQPEDQFITQYIVAGLERMRELRALPASDDISEIIQKALAFCDTKISEDFLKITPQRNVQQISSLQLHYLYACSFSKHRPFDNQKAFNFYMRQTERYWTSLNLHDQAMAALVMYRFGKTDVSQNILRSLKERAQYSDEMGMYWTNNRNGYFWYESPVETQAMLIAAFYEAGNDTRAVENMKIWLLRNKQTNDWKTTKATTEAIHALLVTGYDLLDSSEPLDIRIGGKPLKKAVKEPVRPEAGTGYVTVSWTGSDIKSNMAALRVTNPNEEGIVWGAMYWQYFEQLDRITQAEGGLKINKKLYTRHTTSRGKELSPLPESKQLQVGDVITVRMELVADRDFEYVHLKDMRAAGLEPENTLSGYRFRNGTGYYESIKDASVNFFINYLAKGTYIFEYDLRVTHSGTFSNGITTFQCMYAPEYNAYSEGVQVRVK